MQSLLQRLGFQAVLNQSAIFAVLQMFEKCRVFCKCLLMRMLHDGLHFSLYYVRNLSASTGQVFFIFHVYFALGFIVRHDAVGPDNCPVAYPYPGQDGGADAYPDLVLDDNRTAVCRAAVVRVGVVVDGDEIDLGSDEHVIAQGDAAPVEESAALLDPAPLPYSDVLAEYRTGQSPAR